MVFKKIIFQNRYVALETPSRPPPLHGKYHLKFPFWFFEYLPKRCPWSTFSLTNSMFLLKMSFLWISTACLAFFKDHVQSWTCQMCAIEKSSENQIPKNINFSLPSPSFLFELPNSLPLPEKKYEAKKQPQRNVAGGGPCVVGLVLKMKFDQDLCLNSW